MGTAVPYLCAISSPRQSTGLAGKPQKFPPDNKMIQFTACNRGKSIRQGENAGWCCIAEFLLLFCGRPYFAWEVFGLRKVGTGPRIKGCPQREGTPKGRMSLVSPQRAACPSCPPGLPLGLLLAPPCHVHPNTCRFYPANLMVSQKSFVGEVSPEFGSAGLICALLSTMKSHFFPPWLGVFPSLLQIVKPPWNAQIPE